MSQPKPKFTQYVCSCGQISYFSVQAKKYICHKCKAQMSVVHPQTLELNLCQNAKEILDSKKRLKWEEASEILLKKYQQSIKVNCKVSSLILLQKLLIDKIDAIFDTMDETTESSDTSDTQIKTMELYIALHTLKSVENAMSKVSAGFLDFLEDPERNVNKAFEDLKKIVKE